MSILTPQRRKEAERIADEELLRAIEEAGKGKAAASSRRASRYGPVRIRGMVGYRCICM